MDQQDLFDDITWNKHGGNANSTAANASTQSRKARDRARIYTYIHERGGYGATCDEACIALGMLTQTGSARFSEMKRDGDILDTGKRRPTHRGRCQASVFITDAFGKQRWEAWVWEHADG
jgi:hypothetical protein